MTAQATGSSAVLLSRHTIQNCLKIVAWGALVYVSLMLSQVRTSLSTALCGPWGCTAPLEAVFACHLAWCIFLVPVVVMFAGGNKRRFVYFSLASFGVAVIAIGLLVLREFGSINPAIGYTYPVRLFGLQLIGFIDFPILPLLVVCAMAAWRGGNDPFRIGLSLIEPTSSRPVVIQTPDSPRS